MKNIKETIDVVINELNELDDKREQVIRLTRRLNRVSGSGISHLVRNKDYSEYLQNGRKLLGELSELMQDLAPATSWNLTGSGVEEYTEFELLHAIVNSDNLPSSTELAVPSWIWITAIGDCIGELRRLMLAALIDENLENARIFLTKIQELYDAIIGIDFSKSLVPNLRRKIDIARTLIDKCESDFANAMINKRTKSS